MDRHTLAMPIGDADSAMVSGSASQAGGGGGDLGGGVLRRRLDGRPAREMHGQMELTVQSSRRQTKRAGERWVGELTESE